MSNTTMQKFYSLLLASSLFILSSCDEIQNRLAANSIKGVYTSKDGKKAEFTDTKCIIGDTKNKNGFSLTFDYKVEGKHVFLETKSNVGGLGSLLMAMGNIEFEVIDDNTLKYVVTGMSTKTDVFKRVQNNR